MANKNTTVVEIEGKSLQISNLNKVLYPKSGFTKGDVIQYYLSIAPHILPHLIDKPITMKRFPEGVTKDFFYEKNCPHFHPKWLSLSALPGTSSAEGKLKKLCVINDLPSLVWVVNLASLELHTYLCSKDRIDVPTMLVFDLDPGEPASTGEAAKVALMVRDYLKKLDLVCFPKTSGGKGIHIAVPINTYITFEMAKTFARNLATQMQNENPNFITTNMRKDLRKGKVLIDWSQNSAGKTTVCVYSLRAKEEPTVSTPLDWEEIAKALKTKRANSLVFDTEDVLKRVRKMGDLFKDVLKIKQKIPTI